jgi:hypothetical protein
LPTPEQLLALDEATLRGVGLSRAKTRYLRELATRLVDGRLDFARLRALDDDAARVELTQIRGVGRFTADGVLLLTLRRADIWPAADLSLRRAVARVWECETAPSLGRGGCVRRALPAVAHAGRRLSADARAGEAGGQRPRRRSWRLSSWALALRGSTSMSVSCEGSLVLVPSRMPVNVLAERARTHTAM